MNVALRAKRLSHEDYLDGERVSEVKHEYLAGQVYAMSGASDAHVAITMALSALLLPHVRWRACRAYASDMKLFVEAADAYFYPDLFVTYHPDDQIPGYVKRHPSVIIEVLSPSTSQIDRNLKFTYYQTLASLQEYVLIAQDKRHLLRYRRTGPLRWIIDILGPDDMLSLESLGLTVPVAEIYRDVVFAPPAPRAAEP